MATVEERLTAIEARIGATPLALVPPVTIGELANVPAPGSQIAAQWAQDVSSRIVQRFANVAALKAWVAPNGARAVDLATGIEWQRFAGAWAQITAWQGAGTPAAGGTAPGTIVVNQLSIPADPAPRVAFVTYFVTVQKFQSAGQIYARLLIAGTPVAEAAIGQENDATGLFPYPVTLSAIQALPTNTVVTVTAVVEASYAFNWQVLATGSVNRLDAVVMPKGY